MPRRPTQNSLRSSLARVARLYGIRPLWGETDASLRERSAAASRGASGKSEPQFVWWARMARRLGAGIREKLR